MADQDEESSGPPAAANTTTAKSGLLGGTRYEPGWQAIFATIPVVFFLLYFVRETYKIQHHPCDVEDTTCDDTFKLITMVTVCLIFSLGWSVLAVYLSLYVQRRHQLLRQYLTLGKRAVGDVYSEDQSSSYVGFGLSSREHWGYLTYPHANYKVYPVYVRRRIRVPEHLTREKIPILVLPGKQFSGLPAADVMADLDVAEKNKSKRTFIAVISWTCFVLAALTPIYMLMVTEQIKAAAGVGGDALWVSWLIYSIIISIIIPGISFATNEFSWRRHYHKITEKGKISEDGDNYIVIHGGPLTGSNSRLGGSRDTAEVDRKYTPPGIVQNNNSSSSWEDGTLMAA